jgi:uncharacterized protein YsxB (DUF464 family)
MIIVLVAREKNIIKSYSVFGHAGFKPRGEDIVCAAVSMLTQTAVLGLQKFVTEGLVCSIDDAGSLKCSLPDRLNKTEILQSQAILETMVIGLKNLQKNYSNNITVFRRRWTSC